MRPEMGPPGKQQRPRLATESAANNIDHDDDGPILRPWGDDPAQEQRVQRDKQQWKRRICAARRLSYDGRDELVAPAGRWSR